MARKKVTAAAKRHADFMIGTLAPDLRESGHPYTAADVRRCGTLMRDGRTNAKYAHWLKSTLVPDLRAGGQKFTASDLARCARAITPKHTRRR